MEVECPLSSKYSSPVHSKIPLHFLTKEIGFQPRVYSLESTASIPMVPVSSTGATVASHQISHLLKLFCINIPIPVQVEHFECYLKMSGKRGRMNTDILAENKKPDISFLKILKEP